MKKVFIIIIISIILAFSGCQDKIVDSGKADTLFVVTKDTLYITTDTLVVYDSMFNLDTIVILDTIYIDSSGNIINGQKALYFRTTYVEDLNFLLDMKSLEYLTLITYRYPDISPISNLINLKQLHLWGFTEVTRLPALDSLTNLKLLILWSFSNLVD